MKQEKNGSAKKPEEQNNNSEGYPLYPASEDIYARGKEETEIDPENLQKKKTHNAADTTEELNELDYSNDVSGDDLDVPGSELDDADEEIGSEDEENNYYSLGGDKPDAL
jgi:hypothetical protein